MSRFLQFTAPVYLNEPLPDPLPAVVVEVDNEDVRRASFALFERWSRPAVELLPLPGDASQRLGGSRLGGCPDLPVGIAWPRRQGRPLAFLAQVDLAEAAPHDPCHELPPAGLLSFFYDLEAGDTGWRPEDGGCLRVLYSEDSASLVRCAFPDELPAGQRFAGVAVQLVSALIPPEYSDLDEGQLEEWHRSVAMDDSYSYLQARAAWRGDADVSGNERSYLLGWPDLLEYIEDMRCQCAEIARIRALGYGTLAAHLASGECDPDEDRTWAASRAWVLLAQLRLPGGQLLAVWIHRDDLAARDFGKVWAFSQEHGHVEGPDDFG